MTQFKPEKISWFQKIVLVCLMIIAFSIFYYLVIFLPSYQNKKLEFMSSNKKLYGDESFLDPWSKNELMKDLDKDGSEEWIVIDGPHGSGGFTSFDLFSMIDYQPTKIFSSEVFYQGVIKIIDNKVVVSFGFPKEGDANCCPSRTKIRTYIYRNGEVSLESEKVIENNK